MHEPTRNLQPSVSQIVADALKLAASGLARWLGHSIDAQHVVTSPVDVDAVEESLAAPDDVMCCCAMPVHLLVVSSNNPELSGPGLAESSLAGRLLLAWRSEDAAWLIDQSLHQTGASEDQSEWGSLERSAIAETCNVVGCEFLNAIAQSVREISRSDVSLIPSPPLISQQFANSLMDSAIFEVESSSGNDEKAWLATGTFRVADHAIHTRFAMVWCPLVWQRLTTMVDVSDNGEEES
jgi:hypothetical protein